MRSTLWKKLNIDWNACEKHVFKLQSKITTAWMNNDLSLVTKLQDELVRSFAARALAVRRVLSNEGVKSTGVDNVMWDSHTKVMRAIEELKNLKDYQPKPVKRVYILKADGSKRPLGIPTMFDRAVQALFNLALVPIAECTADARSFGFRKYRSVHDAMIYTKLVLGAIYGDRWVLEADISKFFDNLSHDWLLKNIPINKIMLSKFLKAGFLAPRASARVPQRDLRSRVADNHFFNPTIKGTPQGSLISSTIANMSLDGLQKALGDKYKLVRYADDFIVIAKTKMLLEEIALPKIKLFLEERGLSLKLEKTRIVNIEEGFDFLGFHFREYPDLTRVKGYKKGIFLVKPAAIKVKQVRKNIKYLIKKHQTLPMYVLITKLNQLIRGWAEHFRTVTSKKVFSALGAYIFRCIWTMLCKKHPNMPRRDLKKKYFTTRDGNNWVFFAKDKNNKVITLYQLGWVAIKRYTLCKPLNYFLPENKDYFIKRVASLVKLSCLLSANKSKLAAKQKGICPVCEALLLNGETIEVHHIVSRKDGGSDKISNLLIMHRLCHLQVTHCVNHIQRAAFVKKGIIKLSLKKK